MSTQYKMAVLQVNAFFKKAAPKKVAPKKAAPVRKSSGKRGDGVDLGKWYGE